VEVYDVPLYDGHLAINHETLLPHQLLKPTSLTVTPSYL